MQSRTHPPSSEELDGLLTSLYDCSTKPATLSLVRGYSSHYVPVPDSLSSDMLAPLSNLFQAGYCGTVTMSCHRLSKWQKFQKCQLRPKLWRRKQEINATLSFGTEWEVEESQHPGWKQDMYVPLIQLCLAQVSTCQCAVQNYQKEVVLFFMFLWRKRRRKTLAKVWRKFWICPLFRKCWEEQELDSHFRYLRMSKQCLDCLLEGDFLLSQHLMTPTSWLSQIATP